MSGSENFRLSFSYNDEKFILLRSESSDRQSIKINGVNYAVLGKKQKLNDVVKLLSSISFESILSEDELKQKLSSLKGVSFPATKKTSDLGEEKFRDPERLVDKLPTKGDQVLKRKAKEAEDGDISPQISLKRRASAHQLGRVGDLLTEAEEISKKSGELWECVKRKPDSYSPGYIYTFKLKDEYDGVTSRNGRGDRLHAAKKKIKMIYPAVEPLGKELSYLDPRVDEKKFIKQFILDNWNKVKFSSLKHSRAEDLQAQEFLTSKARFILDMGVFLQKLGYEIKYEVDGVYLNLPDRETLIARWGKLREASPELPPLNIASSKGIADDITFIEKYFTHVAILSDGGEFVHDHFAHVMSVLILMYSSWKNNDSKQYQEERARSVKLVATFYRKIMIAKREISEGTLKIPNSQLVSVKDHLEKVEAALSSLVDSIAAQNSYEMLQLHHEGAENHFKNIWFEDSTGWNDYMKNRFGAENINGAKLSALWDQINQIEQKFNELRKINK